ncbi:unnamed protein product [Caretta caretta]
MEKVPWPMGPPRCVKVQLLSHKVVWQTPFQGKTSNTSGRERVRGSPTLPSGGGRQSGDRRHSPRAGGDSRGITVLAQEQLSSCPPPCSRVEPGMRGFRVQRGAQGWEEGWSAGGVRAPTETDGSGVEPGMRGFRVQQGAQGWEEGWSAGG